ncbi:MAG: SDR family oxidoreductase, partial [Ignavibacteriae bacterium]|nr:SDR family oxidoreductase [Ignavibacteriota bacterium]
MDLKLKNKTVLITAASTGIGRATAELFLEEGANVAICSSNINKLEKTSKEIFDKHRKEIFFVKCDINKLNEIENTVKLVEEKFGSI